MGYVYVYVQCTCTSCTCTGIEVSTIYHLLIHAYAYVHVNPLLNYLVWFHARPLLDPTPITARAWAAHCFFVGNDGNGASVRHPLRIHHLRSGCRAERKRGNTVYPTGRLRAVPLSHWTVRSSGSQQVGSQLQRVYNKASYGSRAAVRFPARNHTAGDGTRILRGVHANWA